MFEACITVLFDAGISAGMAGIMGMVTTQGLLSSLCRRKLTKLAALLRSTPVQTEERQTSDACQLAGNQNRLLHLVIIIFPKQCSRYCMQLSNISSPEKRMCN